MNGFRLRILISLFIITPLGFASKFYYGPLAWWVNDHFGGMLYEAFWILLIVLIWPHLSPFKVALGVFLTTSVLEFLQLWHPPPLELIRTTFVGQTLIGTTFTWYDFPYYFLGSALCCWWIRWLDQRIG
ncbi:DUF2809 domain-containing protein [candidate division KSB1 bacterium]|nr:DUF2809 domain-containing protein [candidate division KSB1 bacterium]NIR71186.1 DUF2809 domain-containing protein [candidate division KSB1 bacterium]NIS26171.1 DUF2809 domain-containing protein [candidate division KSB1 bacterium]NIT72936.1 DUF2809 domain-containing protein [candidate division KSB1 bacterium]NIU26818.1 DUF2809 domain-containing protein [candidate division KSB1 bacterium]